MQPLLRNAAAPRGRLAIMLAALLFTAACASAPARPPVQIGTGDPRVEPTVGEVDPEDIFGSDPEITVGETDPVAAEDGITPPHMDTRDVRRAAVLLPFSHPNARVRAEAESMLAGVELALFDHADENFLILPKDTAGKQSVAAARTDEALGEGADIILGPLFANNVKAVRDPAREIGVPVIAFSNSRSAAGGGAYLASVLPEEEVTRVMQHASNLGVRSFAFLGPDSDYGRRVETAMRFQASQQGGVMLASAFYDPATTSPVEEARQIASVVKSASASAPGKVAVLIPERGVKLLSVAPLLPYNGVDLRRIKMLGTGLWNDPTVWREPTLAGGLFAAPAPEDLASFEQNYERIYGRKPSALAAAAYDAAAVSMRLASADEVAYSGLTDPDGFMGVNGLFRFRLDGTSERGLAVLEIDPRQGAKLVQLGPEEFGPGGS